MLRGAVSMGCILVRVVASQRAFAATLLEFPLAGECTVGGDAPKLHEGLSLAAPCTKNLLLLSLTGTRRADGKIRGEKIARP